MCEVVAEATTVKGRGSPLRSQALGLSVSLNNHPCKTTRDASDYMVLEKHPKVGSCGWQQQRGLKLMHRAVLASYCAL